MLSVICFIISIIGPELPYSLSHCSVVESPTKKGLIIIGGLVDMVDPHPPRFIKVMLELCGDSIDTLRCQQLDVALHTSRMAHGSVALSSEMVDSWLEAIPSDSFGSIGSLEDNVPSDSSGYVPSRPYIASSFVNSGNHL